MYTLVIQTNDYMTNKVHTKVKSKMKTKNVTLHRYRDMYSERKRSGYTIYSMFYYW